MKKSIGEKIRKRNEKLVIQGNEFYVIDLDCLEKKKAEKQTKKMEKKIKSPTKKSGEK